MKFDNTYATITRNHRGIVTKVVLRGDDGQEIELPVTGFDYGYQAQGLGTVSLHLHGFRVRFDDE